MRTNEVGSVIKPDLLRHPDVRLFTGILSAAIGSGAVLLWAMGSLGMAAGLAAGLIFALSAGLAVLVGRARDREERSDARDWNIIRTVAELGAGDFAIAVTDRSGHLRCATAQYEQWFDGGQAPPALLGDPARAAMLSALSVAAWRDGHAELSGFRRGEALLDILVRRAGDADDVLVWHFRPATKLDLTLEVRRFLEGPGGERLGEAGLMVALIGPKGHIRFASDVLAARARGVPAAQLLGQAFSELFLRNDAVGLYFRHEGEGGLPLRIVQIPTNISHDDADMLVLILDEPGGLSRHQDRDLIRNVQAMLAKLPLGLAVADREGRFLFLNDAFGRAAGIASERPPLYPGDLVIREDKAAVSDAVRRYAVGQPLSVDIAVRLANQPDEPIPLSLVSLSGLGDAAVLLSIKDSSEEARLKIQVAQATKMQAVGQLAGGVAHDFNNILTGILGHCELMLMRHAPGDIDYDDIQQVRSHANRAAGLTRQLLAFSRQQTLRPQVLQLPDIVGEISHLLKRLMGETVELVVQHGRNIGPVRADPGQLEQVIVNLAVNARDAMPEGGRLTIQTYAVAAADVQRIGSDLLPVADYAALSVADTGCGMAPDLLPKIFEPFFTTKEVGKGTGLGLSTVYGIVKQSGGYIFADSTLGEGTSFVIYLPVHKGETPSERPSTPATPSSGELWGSGTILLVEDEDMVRTVAERALTRHGYDVLTAHNGEEGLQILKSRDDIDLLVSDVVMPVMDGPSLGRQARALYPDLPIIFMSGYAEEHLRDSIDLDQIEFLPKPFSVQRLAEIVKQVLR